MEVSVVIFIIMIIAWFLTILGIIIFFGWDDIVFWYRYSNKRKTLVRCIFLMPNGFMKDDVYLNHNIDNMVSYDDGDYHVVEDLGFYSTKRNILTMVYTYKVSAPLNFNDMDKDNIPDYDSAGLQLALQNKFIRDLQTEQDKMKWLMILIIVNAAISALIALKVFGVIDKLAKSGG